MVGGENHPAPGLAGSAKHHNPQCRSTTQIERAAPLRSCNGSEFRWRCEPFGPGQLGLHGHDLHGLRYITIPEGGAQIRVSDQHGLSAAAEQLEIDWSVDIDDELHAVKVDTVLRQSV